MISYVLGDVSNVRWGSHIRIYELSYHLHAKMFQGGYFQRSKNYSDVFSELLRAQRIMIFSYWPTILELCMFKLINGERRILFDIADIPYLQNEYFGVINKRINMRNILIKKNLNDLINISDTLLFISPSMIKLVNSKIIEKKKTLIIPNASNPRFFKQTPLPKNNRKRILCVSGYAPMRGIGDLVKAINTLDSRQAMLNLVGYNMPLTFSSDRVIVDTCKYYNEMPKTYSDAYMCVIPHKKNAYMDVALPLKLFDAMAAARPVIVTGCNEMSKIVNDEKCGIVVDDNQKSLKEGITYLLSNRQLAEEMGIRGRNAVEKRHSWMHRANLIINNLN